MINPTEQQITEINRLAELDGYCNLKLSEKDCAEYLEKFSHTPPVTNSEVVTLLSAIKNAFDENRDKKIQEFWQEKCQKNRKKPAHESMITTFTISVKIFNDDILDNVLENYVDKEYYSFPDDPCEISIVIIKKQVEYHKKLFGLTFLPGEKVIKDRQLYGFAVTEKNKWDICNTVGYFESLEEVFDWITQKI